MEGGCDENVLRGHEISNKLYWEDKSYKLIASSSTLNYEIQNDIKKHKFILF